MWRECVIRPTGQRPWARRQVKEYEFFPCREDALEYEVRRHEQVILAGEGDAGNIIMNDEKARPLPSF